jgi:hypothetical protein
MLRVKIMMGHTGNTIGRAGRSANSSLPTPSPLDDLQRIRINEQVSRTKGRGAADEQVIAECGVQHRFSFDGPTSAVQSKTVSPLCFATAVQDAPRHSDTVRKGGNF